MLADVKEDEVFALVGDIRAEIRPHDAVPRRPVLSVEEGLDDDVEGYGGREECVWTVCERNSDRKSRRGDCVRNEREGADKNAVRPQAWCIHIDDDSRGGSIL